MDMINWDNPGSKQSHENKLLIEHIEEVKSLIKRFLSFYNFKEKYFQIANFIAEYHDSGKLHPNWQLSGKEGHSHHSIEYLLDKDISFSEQKIDPILKFLILKHHSVISEILPNKKVEINGKNKPLKALFNVLLKEDLKKSLNSLPFEEKINIVDVFGLFKIADVCSAENKKIEFNKPEVSEEIVKKIILREIEEKRWNEQLKLASLPNISMLRAYTGWGKTNVSLLFFENKNVSRIFYLFPTITAINKFFEKLNNAVGDKVSKYFYFLDTEIKEEEEKFSNLFFIENFTTPYVITTIDQFLLSFLQVGKYHTKRPMFRNSGLIIDEVHLLNPLMLDLLVHFINKYRMFYNLKVLFMSATLPSSLIQYLEKNLRIENFLDYSEGYKNKKRIRWKYIDEDIESWIEKIIYEKKSYKRVLVIVNTVEKAISIGKKLEEEFKLLYGKDFIVFHARFMYKHRKEKENWLENKEPHILIATQVCEVSLDFSYDILFTELSSLPSLIQRFGRVNRYGNETKGINVYIFKPDIKNIQKYPYSEEELKIAKEIVEKFEDEKLKNEKQIIDEMDLILNYERLQKEIEETKRKVRIEYWEDLLQYFFTFDIKEEKLRGLLDYREGFTILIIPHPDCIKDETKEYVNNLLSRSFINLSFNERKKLIAEIKEVAIPIPIWWLRGIEIEEENIFPIINVKNKIYDSKYGFQEIKGEII